MKKTFLCSSLAVLLVSSLNIQARVVTLVFQGPVTNDVSKLVIESYEVAEVISFPYPSDYPAGIQVIKDGVTRRHAPFNNSATPIIVAGPAVITLDSMWNAYCTIKVTPEAFPPDKTAIVLPGAYGAIVTLECSTNLVDWFSATNGVYAGLAEAKFFRIRLDRLNP